MRYNNYSTIKKQNSLMDKTYPHKHRLTRPNFIIKKLLSFIFPPRCVRCGLLGVFLCDDCRPQLSKSGETAENGVIAAFDYHDSAVRKPIHHLKYHNIRELAEPLAAEMYEVFLTVADDELIFNRGAGKIFVIPVPLHKKRRRERGFNQAEELAKYFCAPDPQNFQLRTDLVFKIKNTKPQAQQKKRAERLQNLRGAFTASTKKKIAGRTVVIIDDVVTTGATVREIKKLLLKNGARQVWAVVAAHG